MATVHQHRRADAAWAHGVSVGVSARWRRQSCCARGAGGTRGAGCGFVEGQSIGAAPPREEPPCHLRLHRRGLARTQWSGVPEVKLWRIHQTRHSGRSGATSACPCDADGRRRTTPTGESARQLTVTALRHTVRHAVRGTRFARYGVYALWRETRSRVSDERSEIEIVPASARRLAVALACILHANCSLLRISICCVCDAK